MKLRTSDGRLEILVRKHKSSPYGYNVVINGVTYQVERVSLLRDGGTKILIIRLYDGAPSSELILHRKLRNEHYETFNGEKLERIEI